MERTRDGGLRAARVLLACSVVVLVPLWALAAIGSPPGWELTLTRRLNDASGVVAAVLWPVMQLGTMWSAFAVGALVAARRRPWRATAVVASGVGAWVAAKAVKALVGRARPLAYLPGLDVREGSGTGLGFASGHAAVAFALAAALAPALPRRWRAVAYLAASAVGVARVVYGVHLPLDIAGGAAVGLATASAVELALWSMRTEERVGD
ncbi:MAG: phosphatase PAP2 family protein [Acidimicrobiia bacterium]|nr:phosphatase PAP2 family protein [Acidimicrobiia bacterium]